MSDLPVLCKQCLGLEEHVKMIRQAAGEECKLCTRPFTVFRWNISGEHRQLKKTIFCRTCAQSRNCCQSCMFDIDFGIPLDVRDAALKMAGVDNPYSVESQTRNSEVKALLADKMESQQKKLDGEDIAAKKEKARAILEALATKLSSGTVPRPKQKELEISHKELSKTISKLPFGGNLATPADTTLKSFFVFGFSHDTPQYAVTALFEKFGTLALVNIVHQARCGFITFSKRSSAEECAKNLRNEDNSKNPKTAGLFLLDKKEAIRVCWGSPRSLGNTKEEQRKVSVVVNKVLKQLASKDTDINRGGRKIESTKGLKEELKGSRASTKPKLGKNYKSMAHDFEA